MSYPLPEELHAGGFAVQKARAVGLSPGVLRSSAFVAPHRGIRALEEPRSLLDRAVACSPLLRPWQCLGGVSALAVLGLPVPRRLSSTEHVEVISVKGRSRPAREGVRARRLAAHRFDARSADGIRVAAPALAWALMAGRCTVHELVVLGDAIVTGAGNYPGRRLTGPLASVDDLRAITDEWAGSTGAAALRAALPLIREDVESPRESDMRLYIVGAGMPEPEVQVNIYDPRTGRLLGRADLFHREARVVEEYEGDGHRSKRQWDRDIQKYREFERVGLQVVRATDRDFSPTPQRWLADLAEVLRRRTPSP